MKLIKCNHNWYIITPPHHDNYGRVGRDWCTICGAMRIYTEEGDFERITDPSPDLTITTVSAYGVPWL